MRLVDQLDVGATRAPGCAAQTAEPTPARDELADESIASWRVASMP